MRGLSFTHFILGFIFLSQILVACGKVADSTPQLADTTPDLVTPSVDDTPTPLPEPTNPNTDPEPPLPLTQVDTFIRTPNSQIDILIAVASDRKDSFKVTTDALNALVTQLPAQLDFRIGLLSGHSEKLGALIQGFTEPTILDSKLLTRTQIIDFIKTKLESESYRGDSLGGEALVYSLHKFLENEDGFLRPNAGLAVVVVSNGGDVCFNDPRLRGYPSDEIDAYFKFCRNGAENIFSPESVFLKLKSARENLPVSINGIFFNNPETANPYFSLDENHEYAEGYSKMIELSQGNGLDYAGLLNPTLTMSISSQVQNYLADLANTAHTTYQTIFNLTRTPIADSLSVKVDGETVAFTYLPQGNRIQVLAPGIEVKATYQYQPVVTPPTP